MIDLGVSKIALIGVVALIVIGPEKLPKLARTLGALVGKAQRYVSDVKAEVNRSMDLEELKKMKETMETAARDVEQRGADGGAAALVAVAAGAVLGVELREVDDLARVDELIFDIRLARQAAGRIATGEHRNNNNETTSFHDVTPGHLSLLRGGACDTATFSD